ncbi:hypothetical protein FB451DRAFT_1378065, partial [Mycena latifolia]
MVATIYQIVALAAFATRFATAAPAPAPELFTIVDPLVNPTITQLPLSASIAGVGSDGQTTYVVTDNFGLGTFVQGADHLSFTVGVDGGECQLGGSGSICTVVLDGEPQNQVDAPARTLVIDVANPAPTESPSATPTTSSDSSTPSPAAGASSIIATPTANANGTPTANANGTPTGGAGGGVPTPPTGKSNES